MAGMAEMAQMAAILKYKRDTQCRWSGNDIQTNSNTMEDRGFTKPREEKYTKNMQGRWRDLMGNFGCKTEKSLEKKRL